MIVVEKFLVGTKNRKETAYKYKCENCSYIIQGSNNPIICPGCQNILVDIDSLLNDIDERVGYYLGTMDYDSVYY